MPRHGVVKDLFILTKPGIIGGNLISVIGGYFLAARGEFDPLLFLSALIGLALVIASGCTFNNVIDRDIDAVMRRTRDRPLVQGRISPAVALCQATLLGIAGFVLLAFGTNPLTVGLAAFGFVIYVGAYSLYMKRHSEYGTLVGSLSGAVPPVVGYCAVTGHFDPGALTLLIIFSLWQMPHSYAIAIFRLEDYRVASIPVLPVVRGIATARHHILGYILAFIAATLTLSLAGYAGPGYLAVALVMGLYWLYLALQGYRARDEAHWARRIFGCSILTITALSLMMSLDSTLGALPLL
ncbi:protoheme IX farnesyltransferase [Litchfieldella qijiaojingensis]|uniref:Protoheme IX farnesyltransferase n=1 Tax=Litchfieldella qijiaojingensis TaxID=980347 RepID=A0ABQ2YQS6_9GAMM|nr:heme o synthase [Halomonas qijiaojingensis]GGX92233.1 protoheme IX farnesyltransferase [Halomonas qijiaojingensis]